MGANDDREMLEAAKEECGRLERYNDELKELLQAAYAKYVKDTDILFLARKDAERERDDALAVIADAAAWIPEEPTFESHESKERALRSVRSALAKSPADALAGHDREVKAQALEEFADVVHVDTSISADDRPVGWANRLRARAAQIRTATAPDPISVWNAWESDRYDKHPRYDDAGTGVENEQERDDD